MNDYIAKAMAKNGQISIYVGNTTNTIEEARILHNMFPTPAVALGRVLTGAALMSQTLKAINQTITIQIKGDGPIGGIVAVTDYKAGVRGYVHNPYFDLSLNEDGKFDIKGAVGSGRLNVIKDLGMKEPYLGSVDLVSGEIAEDLTYYYAYSEQTPTVMSLGVLIGSDYKVMASGGIFIQLLPDASEDAIDAVERGISDLKPVTTLINEGKTPEEIIRLIFPQEELLMLGATPVSYKCTCSKERMERNLMSIGRQDLSEIAEDEKGAELVCHFCNKKYHFTKDELQKLLEQSQG